MSQHRPLRRISLAAEIRAELGRQRVSIQKLSAGTGISASTLYRRLEGTRPFYVEELEAIGRFLGVPDYELTKRAKNRVGVEG